MQITKNYIEANKERFLEEQKLQNRRSRFIVETNTNKSIHLILVSASGIKPSPYSDEFQAVINAEALFEK